MDLNSLFSINKMQFLLCKVHLKNCLIFSFNFAPENIVIF